MLGSSLYHSSQPPSINHSNQTHLLTKSNQTVSERALLTSVLHMMLGLPSTTFPLVSSVSFSVSSEFPSLQHLSREALQL